MSAIATVKAFTNGEIAYVSWTLSQMIPGCLGFEVTRIDPDNPANNIVLPSWVAFKGQSNKMWLPQDTSVWPVQKLSWKDFTLQREAGNATVKNIPPKIQYKIRPVVAFSADLKPVHSKATNNYTGRPVRLSYFDDGLTSPIIIPAIVHGCVRASFTNGILSTQWLAHAMQNPSFKGLKNEIRDPKSPTRKYLAGDVLDTLLMLLNKAAGNPKATLKMALYELADDELVNAILANKHKVELILSNTSANAAGKWDTENAANRASLHAQGVKITDRMFNNNTSIGHNKFVIYLENAKPLQVMTGSTNWTSNGLCVQSNNAVVIDSPDLALQYDNYFKQLALDNTNFVLPSPLSAPTRNVQGPAFRTYNSKGNPPLVLADGTQVTAWFSPNTPGAAVSSTIAPPDLSAVYSIMRKANHAIFFAVFLPGRSNTGTSAALMTNVITEAISLAQKDHSLMVYGSVSDPSAMPNYIPPVHGTATAPTPGSYDQGKLHIVRAMNLQKADLIGDFEQELLSAGHAIIHDKIIVVDPFSADGAVIFGSHNQGFKASADNDENLLIIQKNPGLIRAYALHVLDIFEHYRFRAVQADLEAAGKNNWDGFLSLDDKWLGRAMSSGGKGDLADYMATSV